MPDETRAVLQGVCDLVYAEYDELEDRRYDITLKPDNSPVTAADVYLEGRIESFLQEKLGEIRFIGEETFAGTDGNLDGWTAVLDPIDGTENFCSGLKEWGVSLTIWKDGAHAGSLLLLPELKSQLMTGDAVPKRSSRIVGFSSSITAELVEQFAAAGEARVMGCAVYNLYNVITGSYSRFVNPAGAYSWDLLAGVSLAYSLGCEVTLDGQRYRGEYLEPGKKYRVDIRH